jgi:hypothetical protein
MQTAPAAAGAAAAVSGDAMVPLADIFNHKASLVLLEDGWQVCFNLLSFSHTTLKGGGAQQHALEACNTYQGSSARQVCLLMMLMMRWAVAMHCALRKGSSSEHSQ